MTYKRRFLSLCKYSYGAKYHWVDDFDKLWKLFDISPRFIAFQKKNGTIGTQDPCSCRGFCYESSNYQLIRYYATLSVHQINYFSTNLFILTFDLRSVDIFSRTTATQNRMYLVLFGPGHAVTGTSKGFSKQSISM